jgi:hypothetical protein
MESNPGTVFAPEDDRLALDIGHALSGKEHLGFHRMGEDGHIACQLHAPIRGAAAEDAEAVAFLPEPPFGAIGIPVRQK